MSLARCIPELRASGAISKAQARRAAALFDELSAELKGQMAPDAAEALASARTVDALDRDAARRLANAARQLAAQKRNEQWLRGGGESWGRGGDSGDGPLPGEGEAGPINPKAARTLIAMMDARRRAIASGGTRFMDTILERHRNTLTGKVRNPADLDELGRAVFGEKIDTPGALAAGELADAWGQASEGFRLRANAAGADIGKLENRGVATIRDSRKVAEAGFERWYADELPRLDRARIIDRTTGEPFTDAAFERFMRGIFRTIASDGAAGRTPSAAGGRSLANSLGDHRVLHYKSYDDWKASMAQYGTGNVFDAMRGEIHAVARDIAAMEVLGPNPEAGMRFLADMLKGDEDLFQPGRLRPRALAKVSAWRARRLWETYTGEASRPVDTRLAAIGSTYRSVTASARLGGSFLTAFSDAGFQAITRGLNGLPISGMIRDYLKLFNPLDVEHKKLAARGGFAAETWLNGTSSQTRLLAEEYSVEWSSRLTDGVLRATGLNGVTDAGRQAFGNVILGHVTDQRGKAWAKLEPRLRAAMRRYRIGEAEWDVIRRTPLEVDGGLEWIRPYNVEDPALGDRLWEWAHNEMDYAVPVPTLETRAWFDTFAKPGTVWGEFARSSPLLFKTFTLAVLFRHGARMMAQPGPLGKLGYFVGAAIPVTVFAALSTQLTDLSKGQDFKPMDPTSEDGRAFWARAFVRGGGASIVGDLLGLTAEERYMGWPGYVAGPLVTDAGELASAAQGAAAGQDRAAWRAARVARQYLPGQNVWYLKKLVDVALFDRIQRELDPDYYGAWQRMEDRAEDQGSGYWWAPGEDAPSRAPDFANAWEGGGE